MASDIFKKTPSPRLEFCIMQNLAWMIEFSYECDYMLHNAWLNIPYVFLLFVEIISDKHTWRKLVRCTYQWGLHGFRSIQPDLFLPLAFLCTIRSRRWGCRQLHDLIPSTFLDFCWFLVDELVFIGDANSSSLSSNNMAESCSSSFVSDTPTVLIVKEGTSLMLA